MPSGKVKMAAIFLSGVLAGIGALYLALHFCPRFYGERSLWGSKGANPGHILKMMDRKLSLDKEQNEKIGKILEAHLAKINELRQSVRPQFKAIREAAQAEIRTILSPEQQIKF